MSASKNARDYFSSEEEEEVYYISSSSNSSNGEETEDSPFVCPIEEEEPSEYEKMMAPLPAISGSFK